jgi:hypothetical protein
MKAIYILLAITVIYSIIIMFACWNETQKPEQITMAGPEKNIIIEAVEFGYRSAASGHTWKQTEKAAREKF